MSKAPAIGIDLGTSYSCVGVWQNGKVDIIPNEYGERTTPSYVAFTDIERLIGDAAKNQIKHNPTNTIFSVKRLIGRKFEDREVQDDMKLWPFKVVKDLKSDRPLVQITYQKQEKKFYAEEICAMILQKLKQISTDFLGKEVKDAIIAVPAKFNDSQREAIKDAGTISGLNVLRVISEPVLAGIAYGIDKQSKSESERNVLIFDLGSGTFSVSLLSLEDGLFEVRATNGNIHLGGEDFDNRLVEYCIGEFRRKTGISIKSNPKALRRVRASCEKAKRALSSVIQATVDIDALMDGEDLNVVITRSKFEYLCMDLFQKCIFLLENIIKDAKMSKSNIHDIVLIGGSTRIPKIQYLIKDFFNGKELNKIINPDEAVACGAAIQAAVITNVRDEKIEKLILLDATPFSLGIETNKGEMKVIIPRNSSIPTKNTEIISTFNDNQTSYLIQVFEGESQLTKDNYHLGSFSLDGIPPMPRGQAQIEITFDLDVNYILNISAVEKSSGKNHKIVITNDKGRLSKDDIDLIVKEAEKFKDEDNKVKKRIEAKNGLEQYCYQVKLSLNNAKLKDIFSEDERKQIEKKVDEVLIWSNNNPTAAKDEYDAKVKEVEAIFNPIMQKIYQQMGGPPSGMPNFIPGIGPGAYIGNKGTATGGAEDVE